MRFSVTSDRLSVAGGVSILVLIVGVVAYYCVSLEMRVDSLEAHIKTLTTAPAPAATVKANPLLETCQQLYAESVEGLRRVGDFGATARSHISSLNCEEVIRSASKRL